MKNSTRLVHSTKCSNTNTRRSTRLSGKKNTFKCGRDEVLKWLYHFSSSTMMDKMNEKNQIHIRSSILYKDYFNFYSSVNNKSKPSSLPSLSSLSYIQRRQFVVVLVNLIDKGQCPYKISYTEYGRGKSDYLFRFDFDIIVEAQNNINDDIVDTSNKSQQIDSHPTGRDQVVSTQLPAPTIPIDSSIIHKEREDVARLGVDAGDDIDSASIGNSSITTSDDNSNTTNPRSRASTILQQNKWHSPEMMRTFFGLLSFDEMESVQNDNVDQELIVKRRLREELQKIRMGWLSPYGYKDMVDHDTSTLRVEDIFLIQTRCKYLSVSIEIILAHYHNKSWYDICNLAI